MKYENQFFVSRKVLPSGGTNNGLRPLLAPTLRVGSTVGAAAEGGSRSATAIF